MPQGIFIFDRKWQMRPFPVPFSLLRWSGSAFLKPFHVGEPPHGMAVYKIKIVSRKIKVPHFD